MTTETRTYYPVTASNFYLMRVDLAKAGVVLPNTNDGSVLGPQGLMFSWHYEIVEPNKGQNWLRITIAGDGWKLKFAWSALEGHIQSFVKAFSTTVGPTP